ncbi:coiled-coil-helix-coiled-coil-helix domain-containing protein 1-like [Dreissena polymorpha]|uniref:Coiled-coil-helix-coiled-coil-helix domain-containing protein 1 n=1 Tax=Dreissena polymorpha TaxID=45954 RepID=A0A9D4M1L3_DREPO|nr:coiled-coil-helix-coiled-coil-helix domain-containing protein 1-like [Dreissena polymorpha]XP_052265424.1 coiled-coil-helix-coiled-coil-helix domain-containing protein 1-like [Dreissena polymorpha]KAH3869150.1 hypothetical protein DPMN_032310 [Dreissena polymorpha]
MPRLTEVLCRKSSRNAPALKTTLNNVTTYKHRMIIRETVLRDRVAVKNVRLGNDACQDILQQLMSCWKKNEFKENTCMEEHGKFAACLATQKAQIEARMKVAEQTELGAVEGEERLNPTIANKLLRMYPQPPYEITITHSHGAEMKEPIVFRKKEATDEVNTMYKNI